MIGYLQHGTGTLGPFRTEKVKVKCERDQRYKVYFERSWRRVYNNGRTHYINFQGKRIALQLETAP